jgi:hypothetical protein
VLLNEVSPPVAATATPIADTDAVRAQTTASLTRLLLPGIRGGCYMEIALRANRRQQTTKLLEQA